jgi:hypothetical protein
VRGEKQTKKRSVRQICKADEEQWKFLNEEKSLKVEKK